MVEQGKRARVHYTGTLDDGTVFDSSEGRDPIEFVVGGGMVIPGFDSAVAEMEIGETRDIHIASDDAYGPYDDTKLQHEKIENIPNADQLPVGKNIYFTGDNGEYIPCKVVKIEDGEAWFDFNPPLAGKDLNFKLTLVEILDPAPPAPTPHFDPTASEAPTTVAAPGESQAAAEGKDA